ncbi:MAG: chemotaxis protein CheX [Dehalococcoidia bacterium]
MSSLKQEFVNPFLAPAITVWEKELSQPLRLVGAQAVSSVFTTNDVTAVIGVTGELQGNVLYEFNRETSVAVAGTMLGEPIDVLDEMALSALGELANMITGNATTLLAQAGYRCAISPPVMLQPAGVSLNITSGTQIQVRFESSLGLLSIRVGLTEARVTSKV